jgi:4-amino-4-deoxy-L-arabinose transferase-like glycosyltransferase
MAALAAIACIPALVENGDNLPIDAHEAFVARTAQEMLDRGQWLVPYFNGEIRLQKPPLAYWLVMVADRVGPAPGDVSDWDARLPSILSGVVMVLATATLGRIIAGRRTGWLAGLLLAASAGYLSYTHSARPEMLYAALCTLGLACFAAAAAAAAAGAGAAGACMRGMERHRSRVRWWAWGGWALMGLAVLTKGPQLPLLLMTGWTLGLVAIRQRGNLRQVVRPVAGLIIVTVVALWWYAAILLTVPGAIERWRIETVDRIAGGMSLLRWLQPYYFYRTATLLAPWVLAFPLVLTLPWWNTRRAGRGLRVLWWTLASCLIGLSFSAGRRWYYMLPAMAPLAVLTAHVMVRVSRDLLRQRRAVLRMLLSAHCLLLGVVAVMLAWSSSGNEHTQWLMAGGTAAVGATLACLIWRDRSQRPAQAIYLVVLCAGAAVAFFSMMAESELLWRRRRFEEKDFAMQVRAQAAKHRTLVSWRSVWEPGTQYTDRVIPVVQTRQELHAALRASGQQEIFVITLGEQRLPEALRSSLCLELKEGQRSLLRLWLVDEWPSR